MQAKESDWFLNMMLKKKNWALQLASLVLTHEGGLEMKRRSHYGSTSKRWQLVFVSGNNSCEMKNETHEGSYTDSCKMKAVRGLRRRSLHADSQKMKAVRRLSGWSLHADSCKTKAVRWIRGWSSRTCCSETMRGPFVVQIRCTGSVDKATMKSQGLWLDLNTLVK